MYISPLLDFTKLVSKWCVPIYTYVSTIIPMIPHPYWYLTLFNYKIFANLINTNWYFMMVFASPWHLITSYMNTVHWIDVLQIYFPNSGLLFGFLQLFFNVFFHFSVLEFFLILMWLAVLIISFLVLPCVSGSRNFPIN